MGYVVVLVLSVAVGYGVYWLTLRTGGEEIAPGPDVDLSDERPAVGTPMGGTAAPEGTAATGETAATAESRTSTATPRSEQITPRRSPEPDTAYLPVSTARPSWQNRLQGALGLVIVVLLGAAILAFTLVQGFSLLGRLLKGAAGS